MADQTYVTELYGSTNPDGVSERAYGWWMGDGPTILWANIVWILVIIGWGGFWMVSFLFSEPERTTGFWGRGFSHSF